MCCFNQSVFDTPRYRQSNSVRHGHQILAHGSKDHFGKEILEKGLRKLKRISLLNKIKDSVHIFDTATRELEFIPNPHTIFKKLDFFNWDFNCD